MLYRKYPVLAYIIWLLVTTLLFYSIVGILGLIISGMFIRWMNIGSELLDMVIAGK